MTTKPILFSTPMVQAILEDRKTQTRRIIKPQPDPEIYSYIKPAVVLDGSKRKCLTYSVGDSIKVAAVFPKYQLGNILWVRETWHPKRHNMLIGDHFEYKSTAEKDGNPTDETWKPSIYMPKAACRIFLEVTKVRVERLQDISEEDAIAEGITEYAYGYWRNYTSLFSGGRPKTGVDFDNPVFSFESLWESINGKESWDKNPWVWVYDFKRVEKPENF